MRRVRILGAGPAGSAAALSALSCGADVEWFDRSALPRHKVCGEFLTAEARSVLESLGVLSVVEQLRPARIRRVRLRFGRREQVGVLPETAWGLSRYAFDHALWSEAVRRGARFARADAPADPPCVVATGRTASLANPANRPSRLFGFKAHFQGPVSDDVELFFFRGGYVGVNPVEGGFTNVCGLARQDVLASLSFDVDGLLSTQPPIAERIRPLLRAFAWIFTGPLEFARHFDDAAREGVYLAGDRACFVDPFTGSGQLIALLTGEVAGRAAAEGWGSSRYETLCRNSLKGNLFWSSLVRLVLTSRLATPLGLVTPLSSLYRLTRPKQQ